MFENKNIIVGICGGISAYKIVDLVSRLVKQNAQVSVVMTENATKFVTPLTFRAISHQPVVTDMFAEPDNWDNKHIALAEKADLIVVAPATANMMGKVASGIADDMLSTTIMATKAPVLFVPAMNPGMYENVTMQENIQKLSKLGYHIMEPNIGRMACGTSGQGRLPEPQEIMEEIIDILLPTQDFLGKKILITAGPTVEPIDPVRFISNHSSGKMGYAIATQAIKRGAEVLLISGPTAIEPPTGAQIVSVHTAMEMHKEVMEAYEDYDILIMMAAVADYRVSTVAENKIKKDQNEMTIQLTKNPDIAASLGKIKERRLLVGACAETENLLENAQKKIQTKKFDLIMANDVSEEGAGFNVDTNIVQIISKEGDIMPLPLMAKKEVANQLLNLIRDYPLVKDENE